jgi:ABC-type oligopeptide transport system substrate-binding subunit/DNA-binding SARP family transcriptional activator
MLDARLLGCFSIQLDGQPVEIKVRSSQSLLAYLLLNPETPLRRERLAGMFWPRSSEADARSNLRHALWRIRKALAPAREVAGEYIHADDLTVTFIRHPDDQVDAYLLEAFLSEGASVDDLIRSVEVYAGELLPGFYEDWVVLARERLKGVFERKMGLLLDRLQSEQRWLEVLTWSERWIAQGQVPETAYRALMLAHARRGDLAKMAAVYQSCIEAMDRELGLGPSAQTRELYARLSRGERTSQVQEMDRLAAARSDFAPGIEPYSPSFLDAEIDDKEREVPLFVAREPQLAFLEERLVRALEGKGGVAWVSGEAGSGKTALLQAFIRQALETHADLLAVSSSCTAFTGIGDPYLPFREVLGMLAGDLETQWTIGTISHQQARRLWRALPLTIEALVKHGLRLVQTFLDSTMLLSRAAAVLPSGNVCLEQLYRIGQGEITSSGDFGQQQLFDQYTRVLRSISSNRSLLIVLDDLQWTDSGSINLLFHLGRRIADCRVFILGAFRPEEIAPGRRGERHPLEPVLNEFQRTYGNTAVDLDQLDHLERRRFLNAYLESEPNRLDAGFRQALYDLTGGQPLFTIETMRGLQERGGIFRDQAGYWIAAPDLIWNELPAQVEGVLRERVARLRPDLQELLSIASVEGDTFTVQVLEKILNIPSRELSSLISQDLAKRHRLVREKGEDRIGPQYLDRYELNHALIREFLYDQLSSGERRLLHKEVAQALEELYQESSVEISSQLAHHYGKAGLGERAVDYLLQAGDQAWSLFAYEEAIVHYSKALVFLKEQESYERVSRTLMRLGLAYHNLFEFEKAYQAFDDGNAIWQRTWKSERNKPRPKTQTLRIASPLRWSALDPALEFSEPFYSLLGQIFPSLVELTPELDIIPSAAHTWEVLEGGHKYIFHLREDIYWSDGVQLSARDFEFTWKRILAPMIGSKDAGLFYAIRGAKNYQQAKVLDPELIGIRVVGDFTLVVELEHPASHFPYVLGITCALPCHKVEDFGSAWAEPANIVTCGPFKIESWDYGKSAILVRNPNYFGESTGNLSRVELVGVVEPSEALELYEVGALDTVRFRTLQVRKGKGINQLYPGELLSYPVLATNFIAVQVSRRPFDNSQIRRAFAKTIDRRSLANLVLEGNVLSATGGFVPPGMPGYSPGIGISFDVKKAQEYLAQSGFPNGRGFPRVSLLAGPNIDVRVTDFLREQWQKHLNVEIQVSTGEDDRSYIDVVHDRDYDLTLNGWLADYPDPSNYLDPDFALMQFSGWQTDIYRRIVEEAQRCTSPVERMNLYSKADRMLVTEAAIIPVFYPRSFRLLKPWIRRFPISSMWDYYWKDVVIDPH